MASGSFHNLVIKDSRLATSFGAMEKPLQYREVAIHCHDNRGAPQKQRSSSRLSQSTSSKGLPLSDGIVVAIIARM